MISFNTCLGAARRGMWKAGVALVCTARSAALRLDSFTLTGLFGTCKSDWVLASSMFDDLSLQQGVQPTAEVFNAHLTAANRQKWDASLHLVSQRASSADRVSFKLLAGVFVRSRVWQEAVGLLQLLRAKRYDVQTMPVTSLVSACGREMLWAEAVCMAASLSSGLATCSAAVTACEKASHWNQALAVSALLDRSGCKTDMVLWNTRLSSWVETSKWTSALGTLRRAQKSGLRPDVASLGATLQATAAAQQWAELLVLFIYLRDNHRQIDAAACSTALQGLNGCTWKTAGMVLQTAVRSSLQADVGNFASLISALDSQGWQQGTLLLPDLLAASAACASASFLSLCTAMFQSLGTCQNWSTALALCCVLERRDMLSPTVLATVMACLGSAGRRDEGLKLCRRAQEDGLQLDAASLSVVLSLCDRADFWQSSLLFLSSWVGKLEAMPLGAAVASCSKGSQWLFCSSLLDSFSGTERSLATMNSLIEAAANSWQWQRVLSHVSDLSCNVIKPDITSMNSALTVFNLRSQGGGLKAWGRVIAFTSSFMQRRLQPDAISAVGLLEMFEENSCFMQTVSFLGGSLRQAVVEAASAGLESRSRAVACMDHLQDTSCLQASLCRTLYRLVSAPVLPTLLALQRSRLEEARTELQVNSLGTLFTFAALSQLNLASSVPFSAQPWEANFRLDARRSQRRNENRSAASAPAARLVAASAAHVLRSARSRSQLGSGRRTLGHGEVQFRRLKDAKAEGSLVPVFVEHDRSLHAERQALLAILSERLIVQRQNSVIPDLTASPLQL